jgi:AbiV family abortive infection protein
MEQETNVVVSEVITSDGVDKGRRLQRIAEHLNRDTVIEFAAHAMINMHDHQSAARILFEKELYGPARSSAILALEELGKFMFALNHIIDKTRPLDFVNRVWRHQAKQNAGYFIAALTPTLAGLENERAKTEGGERHDSLGMFLERVAARAEKWVRNIDALVPKLEQLVNDIQTRNIETCRQDGHYVSLTADEANAISIKYPRETKREEADFFLKILSVLDDGSIFPGLESVVGGYTKELESSESLEAAVKVLKRMIEDLLKELETASAKATPAEIEATSA